MTAPASQDDGIAPAELVSENSAMLASSDPRRHAAATQHASQHATLEKALASEIVKFQQESAAIRRRDATKYLEEIARLRRLITCPAAELPLGRLLEELAREPAVAAASVAGATPGAAGYSFAALPRPAEPATEDICSSSATPWALQCCRVVQAVREFAAGGTASASSRLLRAPHATMDPAAVVAYVTELCVATLDNSRPISAFVDGAWRYLASAHAEQGPALLAGALAAALASFRPAAPGPDCRSFLAATLGRMARHPAGLRPVLVACATEACAAAQRLAASDAAMQPYPAAARAATRAAARTAAEAGARRAEASPAEEGTDSGGLLSAVPSGDARPVAASAAACAAACADDFVLYDSAAILLSVLLAALLSVALVEAAPAPPAASAAIRGGAPAAAAAPAEQLAALEEFAKAHTGSERARLELASRGWALLARLISNTTSAANYAALNLIQARDAAAAAAAAATSGGPRERSHKRPWPSSGASAPPPGGGSSMGGGGGGGHAAKK